MINIKISFVALTDYTINGKRLDLRKKLKTPLAG